MLLGEDACEHDPHDGVIIAVSSLGLPLPGFCGSVVADGVRAIGSVEYTL